MEALDGSFQAFLVELFNPHGDTIFLLIVGVEHVVVTEILEHFYSSKRDSCIHLLGELVLVTVDLTFAGLVHLGRLLSGVHLNVRLDYGPLQVGLVQNKFEKFSQRLLVPLQDVLVANDVHRDLGFDPEVVELLPDAYLLFHPLLPHFRMLHEVLVRNGKVVTSGRSHVEEGSYAVKRLPHKQ